MVDLYQTGIIITIILIVAGSLMGAISQQDATESFGLPEGFATVVTVSGQESDVNTMMTKVNDDFARAAASSDLIEKTWVGGTALVNGMLLFGQMIIISLTSWTTIVDLLFAFAAGTPVVLLAIPIKIVLGIIVLYTLIKFIGDVIRHLPFFGGG